jgi:LysM repeat protein
MHKAQHAAKRFVSEIRELAYKGQNVKRTPKNYMWLLPIVAVLALVPVSIMLVPKAFTGGGSSLRDFSNFSAPESKSTSAVASSTLWRHNHPIAAPAAGEAISSFPYFYTVRKGDTLSTIAQRIYGRSDAWTLLYYKNHIKDPSTISTGTRLKVVALHGNPPEPPPVPKASTAPTPSQSSYQASPSSSYTSVSGVGGAFGACVRAAENGGSYSWATGNGGGAYQFLASTWVAYGGDPSLYGNAGPAYQDQIFMNAINAGGQNNWAPYDGC